ncbi:MAG: arginine--tRNA ligase [Bacteroidia bacterium]|jgi:arginyl-tRNA synthetase|nr:arginine--tRNA ligase [Bacteroidia bacterium]
MLEQELKTEIAEALTSLYQTVSPQVVIEPTHAGFEGQFTFVVFPYLKQSKKGPEQTASELGAYLQANVSWIESHNVVKGFLNLSIHPDHWLMFVAANFSNPTYGFAPAKSKQKVLVEYSSPNTNKPLHLGHIRNNLLGYAVSQILKADGYEVITCNLVNDRGIHICKSMLAWIQSNSNETPSSSGIKGDHLVGKYYVAFDKQYKKEQQELIEKGSTPEEAEKNAPSILAAQELLRKWEAGDPETIRIWKMMNDWVYEGFHATYKQMGVHFDQFYYESNTYLLGKEIVQEGLQKNVFYQKDDGSVWVDLTADGLDQKLLLRGDGTSVYITQDIGTAELKYADFGCERSIYVVGNEQDYHFKVLKLICQKLGKSYAEGIFHLSYGMVELPHGKMKSREGTVVDADDLMEEMIRTAAETTEALGKTQGLTAEELTALYQTIGLGALKYFLLKVDPRKKMLFNPAESIDFQGNTGPFIQYTYARIQSILRNAGGFSKEAISGISLEPSEMELIQLFNRYPDILKAAAAELSPGVLANYVYELAKCFSGFYHACPILKEQNEQVKNMRLQLSVFASNIIASGCNLLGIEVPQRM